MQLYSNLACNFPEDYEKLHIVWDPFKKLFYVKLILFYKIQIILNLNIFFKLYYIKKKKFF